MCNTDSRVFTLIHALSRETFLRMVFGDIFHALSRLARGSLYRGSVDLAIISSHPAINTITDIQCPCFPGVGSRLFTYHIPITLIKLPLCLYI